MKEHLTIPNGNASIPATLWGPSTGKLIIAIHGDMSNKEDTVIELLARNAVPKGYCVLSFDLPEHGDRSDGCECNPWNSISDLAAVYAYARPINDQISLFACSIGAYFALLAYGGIAFEKSLLLSPVVNMENVIGNMMRAFNVSEEYLENTGRIRLPIGKTLDREYYAYVKQHPLNSDWQSPVYILYGAGDEVTPREDLELFAAKYSAEVTTAEKAVHFFHTDRQLHHFEDWLETRL